MSFCVFCGILAALASSTSLSLFIAENTLLLLGCEVEVGPVELEWGMLDGVVELKLELGGRAEQECGRLALDGVVAVELLGRGGVELETG